MAKVTLTIIHDTETGTLAVDGPIQQKGLCYLMLECAKDAIRENQKQAQSPLVLPPNRLHIPLNGAGS